MWTTRIHRELKTRSSTDRKVNALLVAVERAYEECVSLAKAIRVHMRQYTLHDQVHIDHVIMLMDRLLPEPTLAILQPLELVAMILCAALHDTGMVATSKEVEAIRNENEGEADDGNTCYHVLRESYPDILRRIEQLHHESRHGQAGELEDYLTAEYVRQQHGERCKRFILESLSVDLVYDEYDFARRIADVCASHVLEPAALENLPCWEPVRSPDEHCNWRFVGILLRLADVLENKEEGRYASDVKRGRRSSMPCTKSHPEPEGKCPRR